MKGINVMWGDGAMDWLHKQGSGKPSPTHPARPRHLQRMTYSRWYCALGVARSRVRRRLAKSYHFRGDAHRDGIRGDIAGHNRVGADHGVITDRYAPFHSHLATDPNVLADSNAGDIHPLLSYRNFEVIGAVVVIANPDHLGDKTVLTDFDRIVHGDCAVMPENRSIADGQPAVDFDIHVPVDHASPSEADDRTRTQYCPKSSPHVTIAAERDLGISASNVEEPNPADGGRNQTPRWHMLAHPLSR